MSKLKSIVVFVGPPGSGKGSLSQLCVDELGWRQLSTGNLCRYHIKNGTEIGQKIDFAIKSGKLVSDELITKMVVDWFVTHSNLEMPVILDGFPRTVSQAEALNSFVDELSGDIQLRIIRFAISDDAIIERLSSRHVCTNKNCQMVYSLAKNSSQAPSRKDRCDKCSSILERRKDDDKAAVLERLKIYHRHEQGLLNFYEQTERSVDEFNVEKPLTQVFKEFTTTLGL